VYLLDGLAGTGKTIICQMIAERMSAERLLDACFFYSGRFEGRSNFQFIFPTLAVLLVRTYPEFRSVFFRMVRPDPEIIHESLCGQMNELIAICALGGWRGREASSVTLSVFDHEKSS
jgi:hypothetical protein